MKILLLNLTRFGDLLQTQASITELVAQGHEVGVVCLENFAGAAALLDGVAHVASLPGAAFLAALDAGAGEAKPGMPTTGAGVSEMPEGKNGPPAWPVALARLASWRDELFRAFAPERICNLTPTLSARLLARFLARTLPCTGFAVDASGFGLHSNAWAAFFQGASACRGVSPFNVVDMFRRVAAVPAADAGAAGSPQEPGVGEAGLRRPDGKFLDEARRTLESKAPEGCAGFVALQLGASEDRRRWPVAFFAELGQRLWDEARLCPVILGSEGEVPLARRYGGLARHPHLSLCGATDLPGLAAVLCAMRMLVTNDTGTMHLAAGLDIPVLAVFLATAQPFDTGPYRPGSCSVEPDMPCHPCPFGTDCPHELACRHAIAPAALAEMALGFLRRGEWPLPRREEGEGEPGAAAAQGQTTPPPAGRVWASEPDGSGFMGLRSLSGHGGEDRTQWLLLQRHLLQQFLDRDRAAPFTPVRSCFEPVFSPALRGELSARLVRVSALVELLRQQGKAVLAHPLPLMRQKFLATWQKVHAQLAQYPHFGALSVLWMEETQAEGQDLPVVLAVAEQFARLLSVFQEKIQ